MTRNLIRTTAAFGLALAAVVLGPVSARLHAQEQHPGEYSPADIETGARLYGAQCITCHNLTGDGVGGIDLRRGTFRRVTSDENLRQVITGGVPGTAMPKFDITPAEQNALVAYIRSGFEVGGRAVKVGDPQRGRAVYDKGGCASCHRAAGTGSRKAPDLTDIGAMRSASMIQQSITEPTANLLPINRPVRVVTKDGKVINGRRLNEDTYTVQMIDENERLVSLTKSDLKEFQVLTTSTMPSFKDKLSPDEIADVVAFLLSLKG